MTLRWKPRIERIENVQILQRVPVRLNGGLRRLVFLAGRGSIASWTLGIDAVARERRRDGVGNGSAERLGLRALIPYRDLDSGWDDWSSQYVPMFAMYHGSYGHTLETPSRGELDVDAHCAAVWGALKFIAANREAMLHDHVGPMPRMTMAWRTALR